MLYYSILRHCNQYGYEDADAFVDRGTREALTGLLQLRLDVFKVYSQEPAMAVRIGRCQSMLCM